MALGKFFEDNLEIYNERMTMREQTAKQDCTIYYNTSKKPNEPNRHGEDAVSYKKIC